MSWPTPQDYNEAIQNPQLNLQDPELAEGEPELNPRGLPKAATGAFASVYKLKCAKRNLAVRCFLHNIPDQQHRYKELGKFLLENPLEFMAQFEYLERGIRIHDEWFPVLKMEWVEGDSLEHYIASILNNSLALEGIVQEFLAIYRRMQQLGIAHGDLQHGNISVSHGPSLATRLKLVDYDGMFVPALHGSKSNELGHPNYQHPYRKSKHFGPFLDHFSSWIIFASLNLLIKDPGLWWRVSGGDDCLLFRRSDFKAASTHVFSLLSRHQDEQVAVWGQIVGRLLQYPLLQVPPVEPGFTDMSNLPDPVLTEEDQLDRQQEQEKSIRLARVGDLPQWTTENAAIADGRTRAGPWPGIKHYAEAVAQPHANFQDPELANSIPSVFEAASGPDGVVFYMRSLTRHLAVKCFFNYVADRAERYEAVARTLSGDCKRYFAEFEYQPEGVKVGNYWYPILKMEWVYGISLAAASEHYFRDREYVGSLLMNFRTMMHTLQRAGIAHGDLQPHNILVTGNDFKLLDYDAMYVPELHGRKSIEIGHVYYQHPDRTLDHFGSNIDNYSAWAMDAQ